MQTVEKDSSIGLNKGVKHNLYRLRKIAIRVAIFLVFTVLSSLLYKALIESNIIKYVPDKKFRVILFCVFELFILGVYWHYTYVFSRRCRHRNQNNKTYYQQTIIVLLIYSAIYVITYLCVSRDIFMWVFRITINLVGIRMIGTAPDNIIPYMSAYLVITGTIMLLEPVIAPRIFKRRVRKADGIPNRLEKIIGGIYESIHIRRYEKAIQKGIEWEKKVEEQDQKFLKRMKERQKKREQRHKKKWEKREEKRLRKKVKEEKKNLKN